MDNNLSSNPVPTQAPATPVAASPVPQKSTAPSSNSGSRDFSIGEAIKYGFNFFKVNLVTFIKLGAIGLVINILTSMITGMFKDGPLSIVWTILSTTISIIVQVGSTRILLDLYDKKPLNLAALYNQYKLAPKFFISSIIYGLMVVVGLILFIIPGIYLAIRFQFYSFLIVDKNASIGDAFGKSSKLSEGVKMKLFLFGLALVGLNLLGLIALLVGLLVTIPTSAMATVYVYRKLLSQTPGI